MSGKITALIAPPRSGKSTFAQQWLEETEEGFNRIILCRDVFRLADYGERFNASKESEMHKKFDVALKALHSTGNYHILLDETHTSIKAIRNVLRLEPQAKFIFINTSIDICKSRAYDSGQPDLVEKGVINRMFDNLLTLCNYKVSKDALLPPGQYYMIQPEYIHECVEKIRKEVLNEKKGETNA